MSEHLFERSASSLSQSFSTATEEKEVPCLTVSVTIKPGIEKELSQKTEVVHSENEESTRAEENTALESQTVINMGSKGEIVREKDTRPCSSEGMKTELKGWKGYGSNIYIQPIIVNTANEEHCLQCKQATRRRRNTTINELRRQMQLRQASDWVTKHNQRIFLKGSLKIGDIVSDSRRSSSTSSKASSSREMSPPRLPRTDGMPKKKTRLAKGFVCRTWTRDYLPDLPRPDCSLKETLSVRSYVNISNPFWQQTQKKSNKTAKNEILFNKNSTEGDARNDIHEFQVNETCDVTEHNETAKFIEIPSETVKCAETQDESSTISESSIAESVNLADYLFKSVSLHDNKNSKCKEKSCECSKNFQESSHENFPKVEQVVVEKSLCTKGSNSFPPIASNSAGKAMDAPRSSRVHRPNTVNLTFAKLTSRPKGAGDMVKRSQSSKPSQSTF